ncbi:MAG: retroviral-like aspartic protease family protein [Oscillospiraceae bacterium]|jgi:predicted aspartyl protease|nr:retroviral-like aspartic protease family protein [Oscillospiraceae bacterium]
MPNSISISYNSALDYLYKPDGHRHIRVPIFFDKNSYSNDTVDFIFDTGAYLTVLTQKTASIFGFDKITPIQRKIPLTGFADSHCEGDFIEIPGMLLGGKRLEDVKVAIPYVTISDNILGLNVLEYFNYFIDSNNDKIYFSETSSYKPSKELSCSKVYSIDSK